MNKKYTLDDMVYLCMKNGKTWWTYWDLQRVIKNKCGTLYGEPSISAAIRNMRKDKQKEKYGLKKVDPIESRRRMNIDGKKLKGYEFKLIG
jgi:hypothetical protein